MIYLGIIMTIFLVFLVVINGLLLWSSLAILKVKNVTFWKSVWVFLIYLSISLVGLLIFYSLNLIEIWVILSLFVNLLVLIFLIKRYFDLSWWRSVLGYVIYSVLQMLVGIAIVLVAIFPLKAFVLGLYVIDGDSMKPAVKNGEILIVNKWTKDFQRGDVIVYNDLEKNSVAVKRIIGLPGESVEIRDGSVWINNQILKEDYIGVATSGSVKTKLGNDEYFVLGDNRADSRDSREIGAINRNQIIGEYFYKYGVK
ncbi:MAG TPA: signal peptidase I [bacterium]|nr:signal peptidase I [bacterium]